MQPVNIALLGSVVLLIGAVLIAALLGSQSASNAGRYLVTASPLDVGISQRLCIAVDPNDSHGLCWWEPGRNGCASRSTGPTVFKADEGAVERKGAAVEARFRLQLHGTPPQRDHLDVRIVVDSGRFRSQAPESDAAVSYRADLDIPER